MTDVSIATTVGDVVTRDLRSAAVFARHGIDFCCGGRRTIEDACRAVGQDPELVVRELAGLATTGNAPEDRSGWSPARVLDHVVDHHHAYVRREIPVIQGYLTKLLTKHGASRPELLRVEELFSGLARELMHHMDKEERILFPYIRAMLAARAANVKLPPTPFGTIQNPVRMMEAEHQQAGQDLWLLRDLTDGFEPPADACATWRACYGALSAFERDLHEHVHLENNVLFPAAARLEELG
jgi:regulator of cell morphogenesis and NO signaling